MTALAPLNPTFPKTMSSQPQHVKDLIPYLQSILQNSHVGSDKKLKKYLTDKLTFLHKQKPEELLQKLQLGTFFNGLQSLIDDSGKVNKAAAQALMGGSASALSTQAAAQAEAAPLTQSPTKYEDDLAKSMAESLKTAPKSTAAVEAVAKPPVLALPTMAFGALKWEQYFGLKVEEPKLPPDINDILEGPCPIFNGKKVAETHFLTLIPEGMTLAYLQTLTQNPRQGNKIGFRDRGIAWDQYSQIPTDKTHWVLMTNDVIPDSRKKSWEAQQALPAKLTWQEYELLSGIDAGICLLIQYVETGLRFYSFDSLTWTRCVEQVKDGSYEWPLAIGGFKDGAGLRVFYLGAHEMGFFGVGLCRKFY